MYICKVPLTKFFNHYLSAARDAGFQMVACLIGREADVPEIYQDLVNNWSSLDDLTGERILFVFAGSENSTTNDSRMYFKGHPACGMICDSIVVPNSVYLKTAATPNYFNFVSPSEIENIRTNHTMEVSSLRDSLGLTEQALPCLHLTLLSHNRIMIVPVTNTKTSVYRFFKVLYEVCEPELKKNRELITELIALKKSERQSSIWLPTLPLTSSEKANMAIENIAGLSKKEPMEDYSARSCYDQLRVVRSKLTKEEFRRVSPIIQRFIDLNLLFEKRKIERKERAASCAKIEARLQYNVEKICAKIEKISEKIFRSSEGRDLLKYLEIKPGAFGVKVDVKALLRKIGL